MSEGIRPFSHREPLPPVDARWEKRRHVSDSIKALTERLITTDCAPEKLDRALALIEEASALLGDGPTIQSKVAWFSQPTDANGSYHQVSRELAPIGGISNPLSPFYRMWVDFDQREAHGLVNFGWAFEGPPTFVHGGWVAATFDEFMGCAQVFCDDPGVTGTLSIRYKQPTPINTDVVLHARLKEQNGRKIIVEGTMSANGVVTATCEALFISVTGGFGNLISKAEHTV